MPSDSGDDRRSVKAQAQSMGHPPPQSDPLPCPRCDSSNTKFCYYNNYNLSQPRHFCKSCRRYWTQGGTLRDIPVGGGSRKNSKRSRSSSSSSSSSSSTLTNTHDHPVPPVPCKSVPVLPCAKPEMSSCDDLNLNENVNGGPGFTSLLGCSSQPSGLLALGGYGVGLGQGMDEMGFGYGRGGVWPFPEVGEFGNGSDGSGGSSGCNTTWQMNGADGGLVEGDCFAWPDLAISMPGKGMK